MVKVEIDLTQELGALMEAEKDDFVADAAPPLRRGLACPTMMKPLLRATCRTSFVTAIWVGAAA